MWSVLFSLLACTTPEVAKEDTSQVDELDTDLGYDTDDVLVIDTGTADSLTGTIPSQALEAPNFKARHYDKSERTKADLLGKATVMWFYPLAKTPG